MRGAVPEGRLLVLHAHEQGKGYPIYCRKKGTLDAPEEIYLDQNELARDKKFHALGGMDVSPDGRDAAVPRGPDRVPRVHALRQGPRDRPHRRSIPNVWNGTAWADDNRTFFYMRADAAKRGYQAWRHVIGQTAREGRQGLPGRRRAQRRHGVPVAERQVHLHHRRRLHLVGMALRADGRAGVGAEGHRAAPPQRRVQRQPQRRPVLHLHERPGEELPGRRRAERRSVAANWKDWLPHRDAVFVECIDLFERSRSSASGATGSAGCAWSTLHERESRRHDCRKPAYAVSPSTNAEFVDGPYRFNYSSPRDARRRFRLRHRDARARAEEAPGDSERLRPGPLRGAAPDGDARATACMVPVSILLQRGARARRLEPAAAVCLRLVRRQHRAGFNSNVFSLVDRGFVYAIAHIRGGQEMGRDWYDNGKMLRKMNTFNDFIDVARVPHQARVHVVAESSSPTAAAPAAC